MTTEQKIKLEQAAESANGYNVSAIDTKGVAFNAGFLAGAQTILDNPQDWGLVSQKKAFDLAKDEIQLYKGEIDVSYDIIKGQIMKIKKYRDALERIIIESEDNEQVDWMYVAENMVDIAKEALKQQDDDTR